MLSKCPSFVFAIRVTVIAAELENYFHALFPCFSLKFCLCDAAQTRNVYYFFTEKRWALVDISTLCLISLLCCNADATGQLLKSSICKLPR